VRDERGKFRRDESGGGICVDRKMVGDKGDVCEVGLLLYEGPQACQIAWKGGKMRVEGEHESKSECENESARTRERERECENKSKNESVRTRARMRV
jgi:hypothetical protein